MSNRLIAYQAYFPEKSNPKRFDIYGSSHQIFHFFVVFALATHHYGMLKVYDWKYQNSVCSP